MTTTARSRPTGWTRTELRGAPSLLPRALLPLDSRRSPPLTPSASERTVVKGTTDAGEWLNVRGVFYLWQAARSKSAGAEKRSPYPFPPPSLPSLAALRVGDLHLDEEPPRLIVRGGKARKASSETGRQTDDLNPVRIEMRSSPALSLSGVASTIPGVPRLACKPCFALGGAT
jgi:hypothetical protein